MSVLTHFYHQHARAAAMVFGKGFDLIFNTHKTLIILISRAVNSADGTLLGLVAAPFRFQRIRNLTHGSPRPGRIHSQCQQVTLTGFSSFSDRGQCPLAGSCIPRTAHLRQARHLRFPHCAVINIQHIHLRLHLKLVFIDANNHLFTAINPRLAQCRRLFNTQLG